MASHTPPGSNWGEGVGGEAQHGCYLFFACTHLLGISPKVLNAAFVIAPEDWLRAQTSIISRARLAQRKVRS
jgi:hypothetical protein